VETRIMSDEFERFLATPLADVADNGFSARVMGGIAMARRRNEWLTYAVVALAALPLLFLLPVPRLSADISLLLPALASSAPLAAAAALILLTLSFENLIRER
jgi:hypothetical protein